MCQNNASTLYKWMGNGRLPLTMVLSLEKPAACAPLRATWPPPTSPASTSQLAEATFNASDLQQLRGVLHSATAALMAFYDGKQIHRTDPGRRHPRWPWQFPPPGTTATSPRQNPLNWTLE
ncbi:hypothetical protein P4050_15995 [Pseudomonas aeruginosa]|nr:hypothetical protein [Pseudomonas aeruginosa]